MSPEQDPGRPRPQQIRVFVRLSCPPPTVKDPRCPHFSRTGAHSLLPTRQAAWSPKARTHKPQAQRSPREPHPATHHCQCHGLPGLGTHLPVMESTAHQCPGVHYGPRCLCEPSNSRRLYSLSPSAPRSACMGRGPSTIPTWQSHRHACLPTPNPQTAWLGRPGGS